MSDSRMARLFGRFCSGSLGAKIKKPLRAPQPSGALISFVFGRGERIRTSGLLVPNQALYQAEPRPDGEQSKNTTSPALRYTKSSYRASTLAPPPFSSPPAERPSSSPTSPPADLAAPGNGEDGWASCAKIHAQTAFAITLTAMLVNLLVEIPRRRRTGSDTLAVACATRFCFWRSA